MHFIEHHQGQDVPSPGGGTEAVAGVGVVLRGGLHDRPFEVGEKRVVVGEEPEGDGEGLVHRGIVTALGHAVPGGLGGELFANLRQIVLAVGLLDMGQELRSFAHQVGPASQEVTGGPHLRWIDVGLREHAAATEGSDLL